MYRVSTQVNHFVLTASIARQNSDSSTNLLIAKETNNEQKINPQLHSFIGHNTFKEVFAIGLIPSNDIQNVH